jgi:cobalt-zinc-cadmium efflux system membrane fusion protein
MHAVRRGPAAWLIGQWLLPLAALSLLHLSGLAFAHGGEDHGDVPASAAALHAAPRVVARTDQYELVGILKAERLVIFLDRFADNAPVTDATIMVSINGTDAQAQRDADGTYSVASKALAGTGAVDFVFNVSAPSGDDLLIGSLKLPPAIEGAPPSTSATHPLGMIRQLAADRGSPVILTLGALLLGVCLGLFARGRKLLSLATAIGVVTLLAFSGVVFAHDGHDDVPPAAAADTPQRLPDGSVVVPKPSQRILDVRTQVAKSTTAVKAVSWVGRVISDPNRSGLVQSINGGRVTAPDSGLPRLGQAVNKGDLLAMIEGPIIPADRATISEKLGDIEQQTALTQAKLARARQLLVTNAGTRMAVTDAEIELEGLKRRAEIVRGIRGAPEQLRAPVGGVIATTRVVAGQVVQAQDVLFQIIDPQSLWVEALVYSDAAPNRIDGASALATDGTKLKLAFQGVSRALQQQASVVQFSIVDPPAALSVGQPVTVMAPAGEATTGIIVPRDAVVKSGNGELLVWRHADPERFEPLPVRAEAFDAAHLVIRAGVKDGERIVVRGAELINQVR